ncbi:MAG: efflux RND transporter periplasmic adaptor subunit [Bdellovibrionales bacterium]
MDPRLEKIIRRSKSFEFAQKDRLIYKFSKILSLIFILFCALLLFLPWQQTAEGHGKILAFSPGQRVQVLTSPLEGRVRKWNVREGQNVRAGELIAEMEDVDPDILIRIQQEKAALERKKKSIQMALDSAQNDVERQLQLFKEGISSERSVEVAKINLAKQKNDLASLQAELARVEIKESRQSKQTVLAPSSGTINTILVGEGFELIKPGQPIASIVPDTSERYVELNVEAQDLPFLQVGQKVLLQFEGWPILQLSGLPELSMGTFQGNLKLIDSADDGNGQFRVVVEPYKSAPWPKPEFLRQGIRAHGWIQMKRVPLWFEIWRRLLSLPPQNIPTDSYMVYKKEQ